MNHFMRNGDIRLWHLVVCHSVTWHKVVCHPVTWPPWRNVPETLFERFFASTRSYCSPSIYASFSPFIYQSAQASTICIQSVESTPFYTILSPLYHYAQMHPSDQPSINPSNVLCHLRCLFSPDKPSIIIFHHPHSQPLLIAHRYYHESPNHHHHRHHLPAPSHLQQCHHP